MFKDKHIQLLDYHKTVITKLVWRTVTLNCFYNNINYFVGTIYSDNILSKCGDSCQRIKGLYDASSDE